MRLLILPLLLGLSSPALTQEAPSATATTPAAAPAAAVTQRDLPRTLFTPKRTERILTAQVLLDRARFSVGEIDGYDGANMRRAVAAFEREAKLPVDGRLDAELMRRLQAASDAPVLKRYTLTEADTRGPFVDAIPQGLEAQSKLKSLGYTNILEMLGERFHAAPALLKAMNPNTDFTRAGASIIVPAIAATEPAKGQVARIVVNKTEGAVYAYNAENRLVASYPATIGSSEMPSPSGVMEVKGVAPEATYSYDPKRITNGKADEKLTIVAGPNNPVGGIWIDLTKETYGIHGTPEPSLLRRTASSGCVRLTNWDARELGVMVKPGTTVEFVDGTNTPTPAPAAKAASNG